MTEQAKSVRITGRLPYKVRGYCGTCGKEFGIAKDDSLGYSIDCESDEHVARVIPAGSSAAWWLRREAWLLRWQVHLSPFARLRQLQRWLFCSRQIQPIQAGHFLVVGLVLLVLVLILEARSVPALIRWISRPTLGLLIIWRFVDIFLSNTSITFTSRFAANPLRSVVFSLTTYLQIVLCYAFFYCVLIDLEVMQPKKNTEFLVMETLYFSFGTIATVGYGAVEPKGALGQMVVASELVLGLYFVVIILAQVVGWSSHSKVELGRFSWNALKSPLNLAEQDAALAPGHEAVQKPGTLDQSTGPYK